MRTQHKEHNAMIDYSNKDTLYHAIALIRDDNAKLYALCSQIVTDIALYKQRGDGDQDIPEDLEECLNALGPNSTEAELRAGTKAWLIHQMKTGKAKAADIGQLKDVFGLASATDDLSIETVDFSNALIHCPHCGENVHNQPLLDVDNSDD
jgi:hypothetical protein